MGALSKKLFSMCIAALVAGACIGVAGCSSNEAASSESSSAASASAESSSSQAAESQEESESSEAVEEEEDDSLVIGAEGADSYAVAITNDLGAPITNIGLLPAGSVDEPAYLMDGSQTVEPDAVVTLMADPAEGEMHDVAILCGDVRYTLHNFNFATFGDAVVHLEDDVAYIETTVDGSAVSTLSEEFDIAHPPVVEEPVAEEVVEEAPVQEDTTYYYYEEPVATEQPAQSEDSCVSDIVLR